MPEWAPLGYRIGLARCCEQPEQYFAWASFFQEYMIQHYSNSNYLIDENTPVANQQESRKAIDDNKEMELPKHASRVEDAVFNVP